MFLFQFVKHGQPPTAPQPGAVHTSGLENWGWIFCPFGRGSVVLPVFTYESNPMD